MDEQQGHFGKQIKRYHNGALENCRDVSFPVNDGVSRKVPAAGSSQETRLKHSVKATESVLNHSFQQSQTQTDRGSSKTNTMARMSSPSSKLKVAPPSSTGTARLFGSRSRGEQEEKWHDGSDCSSTSNMSSGLESIQAIDPLSLPPSNQPWASLRRDSVNQGMRFGNSLDSRVDYLGQGIPPSKAASNFATSANHPCEQFRQDPSSQSLKSKPPASKQSKIQKTNDSPGAYSVEGPPTDLQDIPELATQKNQRDSGSGGPTAALEIDDPAEDSPSNTVHKMNPGILCCSRSWKIILLLSALCTAAVLSAFFGLRLNNDSDNGVPQTKPFTSREELLKAINLYLSDDSPDTDVATVYGYPIGTWNVSQVTDFSGVFSMTETNLLSQFFNEDLSGWDVSQAIDMTQMFQGAKRFNQPIGQWDVSSVRSMAFMFDKALSFDQGISSWNVSSVRDMSYMFSFASRFNQPLAQWNVSSVINMKHMFNDAATFDQSLRTWDVSSVEDMSYMFYEAIKFNQPLEDWNVSSLSRMSLMFKGAYKFQQDLCRWGDSMTVSWDAMHSTDAAGVFQDTACPVKTDPIDSMGPFCNACQR